MTRAVDALLAKQETKNPVRYEILKTSTILEEGLGAHILNLGEQVDALLASGYQCVGGATPVQINEESFVLIQTMVIPPVSFHIPWWSPARYLPLDWW